MPKKYKVEVRRHARLGLRYVTRTREGTFVGVAFTISEAFGQIEAREVGLHRPHLTHDMALWESRQAG